MMHSHFRCSIHGNIEVDEIEFQIINHPYFQRLRYIQQLGFGSFVFPCATHSRFAHSLGTMHLAGQFFETLLKNSPILKQIIPQKELGYFKKIVRLAGLLHDIGHAPYSHVIENLLPQIKCFKNGSLLNKNLEKKASHEDMSILIIKEIADRNPELIDQQSMIDISSLILGRMLENASFSTGTYNIFYLFKHIISGEIDVDRMDYLLRDAYFAGVSYGNFDKSHLLFSASCDIDEQGYFFLYLKQNALTSYESFLLARYHMFIQIYFHKSLPSYRFYLKNAIETGELDIKFSGDIEEYLQSNDVTVFSQILASKAAWSTKIRNRETMKVLVLCIQPSDAMKTQMNDEHQALREEDHAVELFHNANSYSSQTKKNLDQKNILFVQSDHTLESAFVPVKDCSNLLKNLPDLIEVKQLCVGANQFLQTKETLQKIRAKSI